MKGGKSMAIDPVCDMEVDISLTDFKSEYNGEEYYFCSESCKEEFEIDPENSIK